MIIDFAKFLPTYNEILSRGLSCGIGDRNGQMCIEAAVCAALGLPHGDNPQCVDEDVREYKIEVNDASWSSPQARASALHDLGIAQLGSAGTVKGFDDAMVEITIRKLIPALYRELFPSYKDMLDVADFCEKDGTEYAADLAASVIHGIGVFGPVPRYQESAGSVAYYAGHENYSSAAITANTAYREFHTAELVNPYKLPMNPDKYLIISANLALQVLRELKSPGVQYL